MRLIETLRYACSQELCPRPPPYQSEQLASRLACTAQKRSDTLNIWPALRSYLTFCLSPPIRSCQLTSLRVSKTNFPSVTNRRPTNTLDSSQNSKPASPLKDHPCISNHYASMEFRPACLACNRLHSPRNRWIALPTAASTAEIAAVAAQ